MSNSRLFLHSMKIIHIASFLLLTVMGFSAHSYVPLSFDEDVLDRDYCSSLGSQWGFELSLIPGNGDLGTKDFCVFTYEAKAWEDLAPRNTHVEKKEIHSNGCDGKGQLCKGGSHNWGLDKRIPASVANGKPWRRISRGNAIAKCQQLNKYLSIPEDSRMKFDLISNSQWQTMALNIFGDKKNWTGGKVGSGCLNQGNNGGVGCGYDGAYPEEGDKEEARYFLSGSNDSLFHIAGNVSEWVKDDNKLSQGKNQYMSDYSMSDDPSIYYAPPNKYSSCDPEDCGYGYGWLDYSSGGILRGGFWYYADSAGVFAVDLLYNASVSYYGVGFRCVFSPPTGSEI